MRRIILCRFTAAIFVSVLGMRHAAGLALQQDDECAAVLDGSKFPELIPDGAVWNALAGEVTSGAFTQTGRELNISNGAREIVARTFTPRGGAPVAGDDSALQKRDALTRLLSVSDFRRVSDWTEGRRLQTSYTFPIPGKLGRPDAQGARRCTISVKGSEHPSLIPESYYWDAYFGFKAGAVEGFSEPDGRLALAFVRAQQEHHLPMPIRDIELFFQVAQRVVDQLDRVAPQEGDASTRRRQRAKIVRDGREQLVRRLSGSSWLVVQSDAARARHSTIYDFPTGI